MEPSVELRPSRRALCHHRRGVVREHALIGEISERIELPALAGGGVQAERRTRLSMLERGLRVFTDIRPGEGPTSLLLFTNVFLILCAYYFIKPLREIWIAVSDVAGLSKMEVKAYSSFGQSLLLAVIVS